MQTAGQSAGQTAGTGTGSAGWETPLEADPADATDQARDLVDTVTDPEAPLTAPRPADFDLSVVSEADLAEQLHEVWIDDDGER